MFLGIDLWPPILLSVLVAASLPVLVFVYYTLRLRRRREFLVAEISELHLEIDYLSLFHPDEREQLLTQNRDELRNRFHSEFAEQFSGENSPRHYAFPATLTLLTTILFGSGIYLSLQGSTAIPFLQAGIAPLAVAGSLLFVFPLYTSRYSSLSLSPQRLLDLLVKMWISAIVGALLASVMTPAIQPIGAFLGSYLPAAALEFLKDKVFGSPAYSATEESAALAPLLKVVHHDRDLVSQLRDLGVRSVLQLAYENPLKIFLNTDLEMAVCIDIVDQANLHLYVPEDNIRAGLNRFGIRTAVDVMTQVRVPIRKAGHTVVGFIQPEEPLPTYLETTLTEMATVMQLASIDSLKNLIQCMGGNPQITYLHSLWSRLKRKADQPTAPSESAA